MRRLSPLALLAVFSLACPDKTPEAPPTPELRPKVESEKPKPKVTPEEIAVSSKSPEAVEEFKKGRALVENARVPEGLVHLRRAVELDKDFPLALAYVGFFTVTDDGMQMLDRAASLSNELSKAERLYIEHLATWRQGDLATLREQRKRLLTLAPNDWRVQRELGQAALEEDHNYEKAEEHLRKAVELNPEAAAAYSLLGYALLAQKKYADAIGALGEFARRHPDEPTAHDTLGEAQLRAGKLDDAEATFLKAAPMGSGFWQAWLGVAQARFFKGDYAGGRQALDKGREAAQRPEDKLETTYFAFWSHLAEGDHEASIKALEALEKEAKAAHHGERWAEGALLRAVVLYDGGKPEKVFAQVPVALDRARKSELAGDPLGRLYRIGFSWKILAEAKLGKLKDAEKSVAFLAKTAGVTQGRESFSAHSFATGVLSRAKGELDAATQQFRECIEEDYLCRLELARTRIQAGDAEGAKKEREALISANRRDPLYLYVRARAAKLEGEGQAAAKP